jgi:hypothetical protein
LPQETLARFGEEHNLMDAKPPTPALPLVVTIAWGTLLVPGLFSLLFAPMMFDAPGSMGNPTTYLIILLVASFPLLCAVSIAGSWILWNRQRRSMERASLVAPVVVACLPLLPAAIVIVQAFSTLGTQPWGLHTTIIRH